MILVKVTAVPFAGTTPINDGFKSTNLPDATSATGYAALYRLSIRGYLQQQSKFLQKIFNHKRRRWSFLLNNQQGDVPIGDYSEEG